MICPIKLLKYLLCEEDIQELLNRLRAVSETMHRIEAHQCASFSMSDGIAWTRALSEDAPAALSIIARLDDLLPRMHGLVSHPYLSRLTAHQLDTLFSELFDLGEHVYGIAEWYDDLDQLSGYAERAADARVRASFLFYQLGLVRRAREELAIKTQKAA